MHLQILNFKSNLRSNYIKFQIQSYFPQRKVKKLMFSLRIPFQYNIIYVIYPNHLDSYSPVCYANMYAMLYVA